MNKVYLVQMPQKRVSPGSDRFADAVDVSPASEYGEITEPLFPRFGVSFYTHKDVHEVKRLLKDYDDSDYILAIGDPAAIGLACAIAAEMNNGTFNVLRWDKRRKAYVKLPFNIRGK